MIEKLARHGYKVSAGALCRSMSCRSGTAGFDRQKTFITAPAGGRVAQGIGYSAHPPDQDRGTDKVAEAITGSDFVCSRDRLRRPLL
jgi:hypothetical protein